MTQITLHKGQSTIFRDLFVDRHIRYAVVAASRGFGKSYLAAVAAMKACAELMQLSADIPNKNVAIIAPTHSQVTDIYFPLCYYTLGLEHYAEKASAYSGKIHLPNNTLLQLWSYESSERMRGSGQYFVVCDEVSSWENKPGLEESWNSIIRPCITTRWSPDQAKAFGAPAAGRSLIISTPKGYNYFNDLYRFEDSDKEWKSYHYTFRDAPHISDDEIDKVKLNIDPLKFAREYEASFDDSGANVFYNFNRDIHITKDIPLFEQGEDVHVAIDFNVGIMASTAFALRGNQMHFLDEFKGAPDTDTLAKRLTSKYRGHTIFAYPDPSGRSRKTSAATGVTDFRILESHGIRTRARKRAPPIVDAVQAVNTKLKNARGDVNMYFRPECQETIRSLERTVWKEHNPDSLTIDKTGNFEHFSDAIRYATEYLYAVNSGAKRVVSNRNVLL